MKVKQFAIKVKNNDVTKLVRDLNQVLKVIHKIENRKQKPIISKNTSKEIRAAAVNMGRLDAATKVADKGMKTMSSSSLKAATSMSKVNKKLSTTKKELNAVTKVAKKTSASFTKFVKQAAAILGVGYALQFVRQQISQAVEDTAAFERKVRIAGLISGGADKAGDTKRLRSAALSIGGKTEYTAKQVADLEVAYGKLGFTASETLNLLKATTDAATVSQEDLGLTAEVVGNAIHAFGLETSDAARVTDVMAKAFTSSALNLQKFKVGIATAGSSARASNVSLEQTVAMLGVLSDAGFEASKAATSLRNIFLISQTEGRDYNKVLATLVGRKRALAAASDLFGRRAAAAAVILALEKDNVARLNEELIKSGGFSKQTAEAIRDDLKGSLDRLKSGWDNLSIILTTKAAPGIRRVLDTSIELVGVMTNLSTNQAQTTEKTQRWESALISVKNIGVDIYNSFSPLVGLFSTLGNSTFLDELSIASAELGAGVKVFIGNVLGKSEGNIFSLSKKAGDARREEIANRRADNELILKIVNGDIEALKQARLSLKEIREAKFTLSTLKAETPNQYGARIAGGGSGPRITEDFLANKKNELDRLESRLLKILSAAPKVANKAVDETNKAIAKMVEGWAIELGNLDKLTTGRVEAMIGEIESLLNADNRKSADEKMSKSMRKRVEQMFLRLSDYLDSATIDTYNKIAKKIKELKEAHANTLEGDIIGRKKIEKEVALLEARLEKLKFPPIPIRGLINIARDNIKQLNEELNLATSKDDIKRVSELLVAAKNNLKDLELIQKRVNARLDPKRTGVLKEDIQANLDENFRLYRRQIAEIKSQSSDTNTESYLLSGATLARQKADLTEELKIWSEFSVEYDKIIAKIQDITAKQEENTRKFGNRKELIDLEKRYRDQYLASSVKGRDELKYQHDLDVLRAKLEQEKEAKVQNEEAIANLEIEIADKVAAHEKKLSDARKQRMSDLLNFISDSIGELQTVTDTIADFGAARDNNETARIKAQYDARIKAAQGNAKKIAVLEEEKQKKLDAVRKRSFERQKKLDIASAIISSSQAILNIWASKSFLPTGLAHLQKAVLTALVAAKTAAEIAKIRSTQFVAEGGYTGKSNRAPDHTGERPTALVQFHEQEYVMPRWVLNKPEGSALAHAAESLRTKGNLDLSMLVPFIPQVEGTAITDDQLNLLGAIVASSTVKGLVSYAQEKATQEEMFKRAM